MKAFSFFLISLTLSASSTFASSIFTRCSNAGRTIQLDDNVVTVVTSRPWDEEGKEETKEFQIGEEVKITIVQRTQLEESSGRRLSRTVFAQRIKIARLNSEEGMPDAYSLRVDEDGSLSDILICEITRTW